CRFFTGGASFLLGGVLAKEGGGLGIRRRGILTASFAAHAVFRRIPNRIAGAVGEAAPQRQTPFESFHFAQLGHVGVVGRLQTLVTEDSKVGCVVLNAF